MPRVSKESRWFGGMILISAITVLGVVAQMILWYAELPAEVPTHFGAGGQPDAWSSRAGFCWLFLILYLSLIGILGFVVFAIGILPAGLINIPNREYWLADERRAATLRYVRLSLIWIGLTTTWFFMGIFELSARVAIEQMDSISPQFYVLLTAHMLFVLVYCVLIYRRFRKPSLVTI
jgi:uncharacterized membrane protein